jgi:hypothetical protein
MAKFSEGDIVALNTNNYERDWEIPADSKGIITAILGDSTTDNQSMYEVEFHDPADDTMLGIIVVKETELDFFAKSIDMDEEQSIEDQLPPFPDVPQSDLD